MRRTVLVALALTTFLSTLIAALLTAPAYAERGSKAYPAGDAPPAIDITALRASNGPGRVAMRMTVPGLGTAGKFTFAYGVPSGLDGIAVVVRLREGKVQAKTFNCGEDSCTRVTCRQQRVTWSATRHVLTMSAPQSCFRPRGDGRLGFRAFSDLGKAYDPGVKALLLDRA